MKFKCFCELYGHLLCRAESKRATSHRQNNRQSRKKKKKNKKKEGANERTSNHLVVQCHIANIQVLFVAGAIETSTHKNAHRWKHHTATRRRRGGGRESRLVQRRASVPPTTLDEGEIHSDTQSQEREKTHTTRRYRQQVPPVAVHASCREFPVLLIVVVNHEGLLCPLVEDELHIVRQRHTFSRSHE